MSVAAAMCCAVGACSDKPAVGTASDAAPAAAARLDLGEKLYGQNCVPCHRDDGNGIANVYPSLHGSALVNGDPIELAQWVLRGKRPLFMPAGRYSTQMLQFGWMKDADAAAVLTYIRSHFGNAAPSVAAAAVAQAR